LEHRRPLATWGKKVENNGMSPLPLKEILKLSVAERVQLAEDIWDSIVESPESLPVTDAQKQELDRRREEHAKDPSATRSWEAVRANIGGKG
jgi:putative addiction module component (TIGR02574 family)